jgi:hypothetical protein
MELREIRDQLAGKTAVFRGKRLQHSCYSVHEFPGESTNGSRRRRRFRSGPRKVEKEFLRDDTVRASYRGDVITCAALRGFSFVSR